MSEKPHPNDAIEIIGAQVILVRVAGFQKPGGGTSTSPGCRIGGWLQNA